MFVMFVVQVGVVTEGGQVVMPFQRCQGQSTSLNASGQLTDGHAYVLLLKVFKCVCVCVCVCACVRACVCVCV